MNCSGSVSNAPTCYVTESLVLLMNVILPNPHEGKTYTNIVLPTTETITNFALTVTNTQAFLLR